MNIWHIHNYGGRFWYIFIFKTADISIEEISTNVGDMNKINSLNLLNIYKSLYSTNSEYTFLPAINGTFTKVDYVLRHKGNLSTFQRLI